MLLLPPAFAFNLFLKPAECPIYRPRWSELIFGRVPLRELLLSFDSIYEADSELTFASQTFSLFVCMHLSVVKPLVVCMFWMYSWPCLYLVPRKGDFHKEEEEKERTSCLLAKLDVREELEFKSEQTIYQGEFSICFSACVKRSNKWRMIKVSETRHSCIAFLSRVSFSIP